MKKIIYFLLVICINATAQNCELITKYGVYDTRVLNFSRESAVSYLNLFKRDVNMSYQQAKEYSSSIGIPIDGVMVAMGMSASEESYKKFVESVLSMTTYDEFYLEKVQQVSKTVNKDIIQILKDCYSQDGIHARIESTEDDDIFYLIIFNKKTGNGAPIKLRLSWDAKKTDMTLNGMQYDKSHSFSIKSDETIRFAIRRNRNVSIPFVLNSSAGVTVPIHSSGLSIFKIKQVSPTSTPSLNFKEIKSYSLDRTPTARHIGDSDEELKRFESTHLRGTFNLGIQGNSLVGILAATIKEEDGDETTFELGNTYTIYTAPENYKIIGYKVSDDSGFNSVLDARQSQWQKTEYAGVGPLITYEWQGDSGRDQDQLDGCWIRPALKTIIVITEKI